MVTTKEGAVRRGVGKSKCREARSMQSPENERAGGERVYGDIPRMNGSSAPDSHSHKEAGPRPGGRSQDSEAVRGTEHVCLCGRV